MDIISLQLVAVAYRYMLRKYNSNHKATLKIYKRRLPTKKFILLNKYYFNDAVTSHTNSYLIYQSLYFRTAVEKAIDTIKAVVKLCMDRHVKKLMHTAIKIFEPGLHSKI